MSELDEKFKKLQESGRTCVNCLMEWIKESHIIEKTQEAEEKALKLFDEIADKNKVELQQFQEVLKKIAEQEKKTEEELSNKLMETLPRLQEALKKAAEAFQESMSRK